MKEKTKEEVNNGIKKIGFDEDVVLQVLRGKTSTYRIRDHKLIIGDKVAFENTQTGEIFGHAVITDIKRIKIKDINLKDSSHYKTYNTTEELIAAFKLRNPDKNVTPETYAFIYTYEFTPANFRKK
mgnify:FL=1